MHVLVVGATGGTGRLLAQRLVGAGHRVRALARDPERGAPLRGHGVEVVVGDLLGEGVQAAVDGVEAVAFCAGSGAATGKDLTLLVDLHGAVRTIDAAEAAGARRYLMLSAMAADDPLRAGVAPISPYLAAKHAADRILACSALEWTIVRPGRLTDDVARGTVRVGQPRIAEQDRGARTIPRADVAATMAACLDDDTSVGATFELLNGDVAIGTAVAGLRPQRPSG